MACGHNLYAVRRGMAECTPNLRAAYDAADTTPRSLGRPPTTTGWPLSEGSNSSSTETKKASMSRWKNDLMIFGSSPSSGHYHPRQAGQVTGDFDLPPIGQHRSNRVHHGIAEFHHKPAAGFEQPLRLGHKTPVNIEAVVAAIESHRRLVLAHFALDGGLVESGHVRRIRYDHVERARREGACQIASDEIQLRAKCPRIFRSDAQRCDRNVGG